MKAFYLLLMAIVLLGSCKPSQYIEGRVTYSCGTTVGIDYKYHFIVDNDSMRVGQWATFTSTVNRSKINSRRLRK